LQSLHTHLSNQNTTETSSYVGFVSEFVAYNNLAATSTLEYKSMDSPVNANYLTPLIFS
jgi:hypothetical protein